LIEILRDADARALIFHSRFAKRVEKIAPMLPRLTVLLQVEDGSGAPLVSGAREYEEAIASASADRPDLEWSPDDLYMTYTGGTTGLPKGVLWRQADIIVANMNGRREDGCLIEDMTEIVERAESSKIRVLPQAPFMHVAGHAAALGMWNAGGTVVLPDEVERFDPESILDAMERERVNLTVLVGDAMARPMVTALRAHSVDLNALQMIVSGGAALGQRTKRELLELLPHVGIVEGLGSSETGGQAFNLSSTEGGVSREGFQPGPETVLLSEDKARSLAVDEDEEGWLARSGAIPLGYYGDREKTEETFLEVGGTRYVVPGDRARSSGAGHFEFLGRESTKINSGGEKIFAEEVEGVLKQHAAVRDAAVTGRPSERFGEEVAAVVVLESGEQLSEEELLESCAEHLAGFKLPRAVIFMDEVERSPAGKVDLAWLREQVRTAG